MDLLRTGVGALAPSLVMHVDHTLMKLIVCDKSVRASGLFPPDAFLAQRMLEARLLRPSYKVKSAVRKALSKAGGCAVGVHLRNRNRFFARRYTSGRRALRRDRNRSESAVEPVWARIKPLVEGFQVSETQGLADASAPLPMPLSLAQDEDVSKPSDVESSFGDDLNLADADSKVVNTILNR